MSNEPTVGKIVETKDETLERRLHIDQEYLDTGLAAVKGLRRDLRDAVERIAELEVDLKVANRNAESWRLRFNRAQAGQGWDAEDQQLLDESMADLDREGVDDG